MHKGDVALFIGMDVSPPPPAEMIAQLKQLASDRAEGDRNFWFLGHYLKTWEDRLLVSAIMDKRNSIKGTTPAQVVHQEPNSFAEAYWTYQRVDIHDVSLDEFVREIE